MKLVRIAFLYLFICASALQSFAQELKPTSSHALLITKVTDSQGKPRPNEIVVVEALQKKEVFKGITDKEGFFKVLIPKNQKYKYKYLVVTEWQEDNEFTLPDKDGEITVNLNISIDYEIGKQFTLDHVYYDVAKANLRPESYKELNELIEVLNARKKLRIAIEGHTDSDGDSTSNKSLSQKRCESVKNYLVSKGVDALRIETIGFGESKPIAQNDTPANKQKNRRTEVRILGGYFDE